MQKPKSTSLRAVGMTDREAGHQLVWTLGWTFTFLLASIFFLQGA